MAGHFRVNGENLDGDGGKETKTASLLLSLTNDVLSFNKCAVELRNAAECQVKIQQFQDLDICATNFNSKRAVSMVMGETGRLVCDVLLDQSILPGVGNIIKNEALFDSGIHPGTRIEGLTEGHISHLVQMTRDFSMIFYKCRRDNKPLQPYMKVYRKSKCTQCSDKVTNTRMGEDSERLTCFCVKCQVNDVTKITRRLPSKNSLLAWVQIPTDGASWTCTHCTLINTASCRNCQVCLSPRTAATAAKSKDRTAITAAMSSARTAVTTAISAVRTAPTAAMSTARTASTAAMYPDVTFNTTQSKQKGCKRRGDLVAESGQGAKYTKMNLPLTDQKGSSQKDQGLSVANKAASRRTISICEQHKKLCIMRQVHKKGPNLHRMFYTCSLPRTKQCNFFQWADDKFPQCSGHGKRCVLRTVIKQGPNNGRHFFACSLDKKRQCQYFEWAQEFD